ncbi:MAG TPA: response regulator transcription factor [Rhodocyclaceae bacterium]|nr:response regulator transcription factor [Rhodocyclaceae bacterium]
MSANEPQKNRPLVLIVEDEPDVARLIERTLRSYAIDTTWCRNARELFERLGKSEPDACIIDLGLPDMDGLEVMKRTRAACNCGLLIVTGRSDVSDRVVGLELGADDYITKPFEPRELVARVRSVIRRRDGSAGGRAATGGQPVEVAVFAGWRFAPATNTLIAANGERSAISAAEADLLGAFLRHPNRILQRDALIGRELLPSDRSIDVRVSRLRRKLEPDPQHPHLIKTVYGAGYLVLGKVSWETMDADDGGLPNPAP